MLLAVATQVSNPRSSAMISRTLGACGWAATATVANAKPKSPVAILRLIIFIIVYFSNTK